MKRHVTLFRKKRHAAKVHLLILGLWGLGFLLSAHTAANWWQAQAGKTRIALHNHESDWQSRFEWDVFKDDGDFEGWQWGNGTPWNHKLLPLFSSSSGTTYNGKSTNRTTGYITMGPGQRFSGKIRANFEATFGSRDDNYTNVTFATDHIYQPASLTEESTGLNTIEIKWTKGTDMPDAETKYVIHVNGNTVATLDGNKRTYTITSLFPHRGYSIGVATHTNGGSRTYDNAQYTSWGSQTSQFRVIHSRTQGLHMEASDGTFASRVRLNWDKIISNDLSNYRVLRSKLPPNETQYEEMSIVSGLATSYNDYNAIPGYVYEYKIEALNSSGVTLDSIHDPGFGKPVGSIQGKIHTRSRIGEKGVRVCAKPKNPVLPAGSQSLAHPHPDSGFCVSSTITGRYEIRNLYFFDSATYVVTPYYKDHIFDPMNEEIILDLNTKSITSLNFVDTSAIGIGGTVFFPLAESFGGMGSDTMAVKDAEVWIDGLDKGIRTDARGHWEYAISDTGNYTFEVKFKDHRILPLPRFTDPDSIDRQGTDTVTVLIVDDNTHINFLDIQTDSIDIRAQDACGGALVAMDSIQIHIEHKRGKPFFERIAKTNQQGLLTLVLPATDFNLSFGKNQPISIDPNAEAQLDSLKFKIDLSARDSTTFNRIDTTQTYIPADTTIIGLDTVITPPRVISVYDTISGVRTPQPLAHFLYFSAFEVKLDWRASGAQIKLDCGPTGPMAGDSVIILNALEYYPFRIEIYDSEHGCLIDTGNVQIFDFIADNQNAPVDVPVSKGIASYEMIVGEPNTYTGGSHPYEKAFFINVTAGSRRNQPFLYWALVQGTEELTPTFTSRSPEIPDFIVHDPPGDASYAWIEKGSSIEVEENTRALVEDKNGNIYFDLILGVNAKLSVGIGAEVESELASGVQLTGSSLIGKTNTRILGNTFTYTFSENYSTSSDPIFTGYDGDVYIGKATNQRFSIARVLIFDTTTCIASVQQRPNLDQVGIASTFIYAEKHIKGVLVPQLSFIEGLLRKEASRTTDPTDKARLQSEADSFKVDGMNWENIIAQNALQRDSLARDNKDNVSFSSGAPFERTITTNNKAFNSYEYIDYVENSGSIGVTFVVKSGLWAEGKSGIAGTLRRETTVSGGSESNNSFTVGYHLEDDDFGDYFSVDILQDTFYNVPAFRLWAGTSSCPHEPGTQPRDKAKILVIPPRVDNVKPGDLAHFTATLTNRSESYEQREYHVKAITRTNPHGASIKLGGNLINNRTVSFFLDTLGYDIDMTVERGPRAYGYERIGIMMYPPCEYDLWTNNGQITSGDTAWITVNFQTECSPVNIVRPTNNWFVNDQTGPILAVDFGGYERGNNYLQSITLEYKQEGTDWVDGPTVPKDSLKADLYRVLMDFTNLTDGKYWLRGRADCSSNQGILYSPELVGMVDRYSTSPMGRPFPADGFLRRDQQIIVKWDQPIDTVFSNRNTYFAPPKISLRTLDIDEEIPFTIDWNADNTEMYLVPLIDIFNDVAYKGVELRARVEGVRSAITPDQDFQVYPITWNFQINTSPVIWTPEWVVDTMIQGSHASLRSSLQNVTKLLKPYLVVYHPDWVIPSDYEGNVLPFNERPMEFAVVPGLAPGFYQDSVVVLIDFVPETLILNLEVISKTPDWRINPSDFDYSMKMIVAISLDSSDTNLSRDPRDRVGLFSNGECRGFAQLEYVPEVDQYLAYLNLYSMPVSGEVMYFRLWRAEDGQYFEAKDSLVFYSNMAMGRITRPHILHPEHTYQVIPLEKGWNWVSFNVTHPNMSVDYLLKSLGSAEKGNALAIKRKDGLTATFAQKEDLYKYDPDQWSGELQQLDIARGYMLHLSDKADTLWMPGKPAENIPEQEIFSGWNWIGYPKQVSSPINDALSEATFYGGDLLTSQYAIAEYRDIDKTWIGNLRMMTPGEGYRLLLSEGKTYDPLQLSRTDSAQVAIEHTKYESSMTIIAEVTFADDYDMTMERLVVRGFVDGECRGTGKVEWVPYLSGYRIIFSLAGNPIDVGKDVQFKLYDMRSGVVKTAHNQEFFNLDRILGTMEQPLVLFQRIKLYEKGYFLEPNTPNPFSAQTTIDYILPETQKVRIIITDRIGRIVTVLVDEEQIQGEHFATFDGTGLSAGIYFCTMQAGDFVASRKMILTE